MRVLVAGENEALTNAIRKLISAKIPDCASTSVVRLAQANERLLHKDKPDFLILVLSPNVEQSLAVLRSLRSAMEGSIFAVGPAAEPKLILRAMRDGADQYLDEEELDKELEAVFARMKPEPEDLGRLISVLAPSGGSGASTLAVNIATVLAKQHQRSLLLDLRLEAGDLAAMLNLKPTHTLADLCANGVQIDRTMFEKSLLQHESGVHLLPPARSFAEICRVTAAGVNRALSLGRAVFPYVVADLDDSFHPEQRETLRQSEVILLVLRLDFTSLRNTRRTLDYFQEGGISRDHVRLVANRHGQSKELSPGKAEEALGVKIFHYIPDDPKTINRANNIGVPAVLENPWAKVSKSLTQLAMSVNGRHHENHESTSD